MQMVQVIEGKIMKYCLPRTGYLSDGSSVSGYDILMRSDPELAKEEGWLLLEDNPPEYDKKTQYIINDGYEILEDKVIKKYIVEDIPDIPEKPTVEELQEQVLELQEYILEQEYEKLLNQGGM